MCVNENIRISVSTSYQGASTTVNHPPKLDRRLLLNTRVSRKRENTFRSADLTTRLSNFQFARSRAQFVRIARRGGEMSRISRDRVNRETDARDLDLAEKDGARRGAPLFVESQE